MNPEALVKHCSAAVNHYKELERLTGENFNLFQILKSGHYEVSTHSPLLGNLLDPNGTHGQGSIFLKLFKRLLLQNLGRDRARDLTYFEEDTAKVMFEVHLGTRTETEGGRLDILVTDGGSRQIAIENKIYAGEQHNWVQRYRNGIRKDALLIYLTLDGEKPEEIKGASQNDVVCLSYRNDVIEWLKLCRKEVSTVPIVRESLTQYIHLIHDLTRQNTSNQMNKEIISSVLQDSQSFSSFRAIRDADSAVKGQIIRNLASRIRERVPSDFPLISIPDGKSAKNESFKFSTPTLERHSIAAVVSFDNANYRNCFFGFQTTDGTKMEETKNPAFDFLLEKLTNFFPEARKSWIWPAWAYWKNREHWDYDVLQFIEFESERFDSEFLDIIRILRDISIHFEKSLTPED